MADPTPTRDASSCSCPTPGPLPQPAAPAASTADSGESSSAAESRVIASDLDTGLAEYPQWDGTSLGLPRDFILYSYNTLKG